MRQNVSTELHGPDRTQANRTTRRIESNRTGPHRAGPKWSERSPTEWNRTGPHKIGPRNKPKNCRVSYLLCPNFLGKVVKLVVTQTAHNAQGQCFSEKVELLLDVLQCRLRPVWPVPSVNTVPQLQRETARTSQGGDGREYQLLFDNPKTFQSYFSRPHLSIKRKLDRGRLGVGVRGNLGSGRPATE